MTASGVCQSCRGIDLAIFGKEGRSEPEHCYGRADRPALPGVLGGYRCSCDCRNWVSIERVQDGYCLVDCSVCGTIGVWATKGPAALAKRTHVCGIPTEVPGKEKTRIVVGPPAQGQG